MTEHKYVKYYPYNEFFDANSIIKAYKKFEDGIDLPNIILNSRRNDDFNVFIFLI